MSWSKLKTIMIYILLLLNLFLLGLVGMNRLRARRYQTAAVTEAAAVLTRNNIQVRPEDLPREMKLPAVVAIRDIQKEEQLVRAFLGEDIRANASGGGLYVYEGKVGTASFRGNGEFTITYNSPSDWSVTPREMMERLDLDIGRTWEKEGLAAAEQSLNGVPVYPSSSGGQGAAGMTFQFDSHGQLCGVSGRLFLGKITASQEEQPISVSTALIAFFNFVVDSGDLCRELTGMTPVYRAAAGEPVHLTPAWRISTDTGDYFVDAVSVEVSRTPAEE